MRNLDSPKMSLTNVSLVLLCLTTVYVQVTAAQRHGQLNLLQYAGNEAVIRQELAKLQSPSLKENKAKALEELSAFSSQLHERYSSLQGHDLVHKLASTLQGSNSTSQCLGDILKLLLDIIERKPYTIQVLDALGKLPSGVTKGNFHWMGSYDVCTGITAYDKSTNRTGHVTTRDGTERIRFAGRYCTLTFMSPVLMMKLPPELTALINMMLGTCVPNTCSAEEIFALTNLTMPMVIPSTLLRPTGALCAVPAPWTAGDIVAIVLTAVVLLLALAGTTYDIVRRVMSNCSPRHKTYAVSLLNEDRPEIESQREVSSDSQANLFSNDVLAHGEDRVPVRSVSACVAASGAFMHQFLISFSFITNGEKLLGSRVREGQLGAVNGMRFISMSWVILGHTYFFDVMLMNNVFGALEFTQRFTFQAIVNATFSVDSFFFLSGLLVAYLLLRELAKTGGKTNWAMFYFHRFWRLTPVYMFLVMIYTTLFLHMFEGPLMRASDKGAQECKKYWWTNLLYINNFVPLDMNHQCFGWAWYLANDMQFFIISPFIIYILYRWRYAGYSVIGVLILGCLIGTGIATRHNYGTERIYVQPMFRISPYLVGITTGCLLHLWEARGRPRMHKGLVAVGWCVAATINMAVLYGLYQPPASYKPLTPDVNALYAAMSRFSWSLGLAWVIFACATGYGGPVNTLLSWHVWAPLGRLTYCAYLVHPMVLLLYNFDTHQAVYATDLSMSYKFVANLVISYAVAFVTSLLVEAPMMGLEKIIFRKKKD